MILLMPVIILASSLDNPANREVQLRDGDLFRSQPSGSIATPVKLTSCGCVGEYDVDGGQVAVIQARGDQSIALQLLDLASRKVLVEIAAPFLIPESGQKEMRKFDGVVRKVLLDSANSVAYLLLVDGATAWTLLRVDLRDRATAWITSGLDMFLVRSGQYRSHLVVLLHKLKLSPGRFLAYFLIDNSGKEIGLIGTTEGELEEFAQLYATMPERRNE